MLRKKQWTVDSATIFSKNAGFRVFYDLLDPTQEFYMAKPTTIKIRLNSSAGTGHFYVTKKNARTMTEKMVVRKYDPVARKHVNYKEGKIK